MTPTKLAALVGAIPPYANPRWTAARQLLADQSDGCLTAAQLTQPTLQQAITAITSYQQDCQQLRQELADIPTQPVTTRTDRIWPMTHDELLALINALYPFAPDELGRDERD